MVTIRSSLQALWLCASFLVRGTVAVSENSQFLGLDGGCCPDSYRAVFSATPAPAECPASSNAIRKNAPTSPKPLGDKTDSDSASPTAAAVGADEVYTQPGDGGRPWIRVDCMRAKDKEYCAFVNPSFSGGQGLSVITTAERLAKTAALPVFTVDRPASQAPHPRSPTQPWAQVAIAGKNIGIVSTRPIRAGEHILSRTPSVMADGSALDDLDVPQFSALLNSAVRRLPPDHSRGYLNLSASYGSSVGDTAYRILATNAFRTGVGDGEADFHSVFLDISRLNHGCRPNSAYYFDPITLTQNVYAVVDIMPGEELTVSYVDPTQTHAERTATLQRHYGFTCSCPRCAVLPHIKEQSDRRIQAIRALWQELDNYARNGTGTPAKAELLVALFELEGLQARLYEAHYRLALEWNGVGDDVRATQAAHQCLDRGILLRGPDQPFAESMRELIADPQAHWSWQFRRPL